MLITIIVLTAVILINGFSVSFVAAGAKYYHQIDKLSGSASYNLIAAIKEKLREKGYYKNIDKDEHKGLYDGEFEWSLDKYRKDNHLEKDKTLKETLKSLGLINDK